MSALVRGRRHSSNFALASLVTYFFGIAFLAMEGVGGISHGWDKDSS